MLTHIDDYTFTLENFEGPLALLYHLVKKEEMDIHDITIQQIIEQYADEIKKAENLSVDSEADTISLTASLMMLKSKTLLPTEKGTLFSDLNEETAQALIPHLLEYYKFKKASHDLSTSEDGQALSHPRAPSHTPPQKTFRSLGVDHLSLEDLSSFFKEALENADLRTYTIPPERWTIPDKMKHIRNTLTKTPTLSFSKLFTTLKSREEVIVTFLAILELMKLEEIRVENDKGSSLHIHKNGS
jgi:segregation and condensation protein A